jgi:hypothetical protein
MAEVSLPPIQAIGHQIVKSGPYCVDLAQESGGWRDFAWRQYSSGVREHGALLRRMRLPILLPATERKS